MNGKGNVKKKYGKWLGDFNNKKGMKFCKCK